MVSCTEWRKDASLKKRRRLNFTDVILTSVGYLKYLKTSFTLTHCLIIDPEASKNENKTTKLSYYCFSIVRHRMLSDFCATLYTNKRLCLLYVAWLDRQEINMLLYFNVRVYIFIDTNNLFSLSCFRGIIVAAYSMY